MGSPKDEADVRSTLGSYRLHGEIGRDPLGVLLLACPAGVRSFPKWAVVRRLHAGIARDPVMVHAFLAATQASVRMVHPNIATTFDFGGKMNLPWAAREHLFGATLIHVIERATETGTRVPWAVAAYVIAEACRGVAAVRTRLPSYGPPMGFLTGASVPYVFLTQWGDVKVVDGCLPLVDGVPLIDSRALPYRAREPVAEGLRAARTDAFGLAVALWELIAGRRLFAGSTDDETHRLLDAKVVPSLRQASRVPQAVEEIVLQGLGKLLPQKPPFETATALGDELSAALVTEGQRPSSEDVVQLLTGLLQESLAAQKTAVSVAWAREQAMQDSGDESPDFLSDADVTRVTGDTVRETTTETALVRRGVSDAADGFDDVPTSLMQPSTEAFSWRNQFTATPVLAPSRGGRVPESPMSEDPTLPRDGMARLIDDASDPSIQVAYPRSPRATEPAVIVAPSTPPPPPATTRSATARSATDRSAWTPLALPPVERVPVPISERAPRQQRATVHTEPAPTSTPAPRERSPLLLMGIVSLIVAFAALVLFGIRGPVFGGSQPTATTAAPTQTAGAHASSTPTQAPVQATTPVTGPSATRVASPTPTPPPVAVPAPRNDGPWTSIPVVSPKTATPGDLPRALDSSAPAPTPISAPIVVRRSSTQTTIPLPPTPKPLPRGGRSGLLTVICNPACDDVLDGARSLGPSPVFRVTVPAGPHRLRLRVDSPAAAKTVTVNVEEGETATVRETVSP